MMPAASPVEDRIIYVHRTAEGSPLVATHESGRAMHRVANLPPGDYERPRFSRDGKRMLLIRKRTDVLEMPADGSAPPEVRWQAGLEGVDSVAYAADGDGYLATIIGWEGDLWLAEGSFP
jgi:hypothetical protein